MKQAYRWTLYFDQGLKKTIQKLAIDANIKPSQFIQEIIAKKIHYNELPIVEAK